GSSLVRFLTALTPALNTRLACAWHVLGTNYTATLHLGTLKDGAVLHVTGGAVSGKPATAEHQPNVSLPRGALVQPLMGYAGWRALKDVFPD
ncbi:hypothetical protein B0H10DRAFT_2012273, partial [Mycena sp. CBHHK59/15]